LVEKVAESWRERLETKRLSLDVRLGKQEGWVTGDPKRLAWAVENLLSNAHNYTLAGGKVKVRVSQVNGEVCLDVTDTGIGIAVADQPYLFTRFFRATHEETYDVGGVGLGLFITRSIIELHGGRVWARSKLGLGSTFSLALPVLEQREGDEDVGARNARQLARPQEQ
jgi:signal transduction histidine kinase